MRVEGREKALTSALPTQLSKEKVFKIIEFPSYWALSQMVVKQPCHIAILGLRRVNRDSPENCLK